jgi:hypothetical protein
MQNLGTRLDMPNNMWVRLGEFWQAPIACQHFYVTYSCILSTKQHSFKKNMTQKKTINQCWLKLVKG